MSDLISLEVMVKYTLPNMVDRKSYAGEFCSDPFAVFEAVVGRDSPAGYADDWEIADVKVKQGD